MRHQRAVGGMLGTQQLDAEELGLAGLVIRMLHRALLAAALPAARTLRTARAARRLREFLGQHHRRALHLGLKPQKRAHERAQVEIQRERRARRRAGNAHNRHAVDDGEAGMMPRPMVRLVADHLPHVLHDLARPVVGTLRRPGVEHHDVGHLDRARNGVADGALAIGHDVERHELPAPLLALRTHQNAVRLEILAAPGKHFGTVGVERHAGSHQLVAGGDERHARAAHHGHLGVVAAADARGDVRRHHGAGRGQHVAAAHAASHRARAGAKLRRAGVDSDVPLVLGYLHMLDHDSRIEPFRHRHARVRELPIDAAHPLRRVGQLAGGQVGEVGPVQRDGVHGAGQRRGHVVARLHVVRQHAPDGVCKRHLLDHLALHLAHVRRIAFAVAAPTETGRLRLKRGKRLLDRFLARQLNMLGMISHRDSFPKNASGSAENSPCPNPLRILLYPQSTTVVTIAQEGGCAGQSF